MKPVWDEQKNNSKVFEDIILDEGIYDGVIKKAEWVNVDYMVSDYNPNGSCLSTWIDIPMESGPSKRLFDKTSITRPARLNEIRAAVGLPSIKKNENFDEKELVGRKITVEVDRYTSKAGKLSNIVKAFIMPEVNFERHEYDGPIKGKNDDESSVEF